jgi:hypothetical protein
MQGGDARVRVDGDRRITLIAPATHVADVVVDA